jgi:cytochrome P450
MNDRKNNFWTAPAHSQHYCLGKSESQCEYSLACALFADSFQQRIENNPNLGFMLDEPLAQLEIYKQQDTKVWAKA